MADKKTLILIESPNKRHCFEHALGTDKYVVMASVGNVYDLPKTKFGIDIDNDFKAEYTIMDDKVEVVRKIKEEYKKCKDIILSTDDDVEGEGISWGLSQILGVKTPMRAIYHDTNPQTIKNAIQNLVPLNMNKVSAQHCRRYLDRIIGFQISPILWKVMNSGSLSAGRVQSIACRLIMEKHMEVQQFFESETQSYFKVNAILDQKYKAVLYTTKKNEIESDHDDGEENEEKPKTKLQIAKIPTEKETKSILTEMYKSNFTVTDVTEKDSIKSPPPPFTTTTVCQEASRKLGMTTKRTMDAAQNLFANGHCTYHRTDSVILSNEAVKSIRKKILEDFGKEYHREMQYKNKGSAVQAAHECLRVTNPDVKTIDNPKMSNDEHRLYNLIWRRTIASQMAPARFKTHTAEISISKLKDYKFIAEYEECTFDGFLKVYNPNRLDDEEENTEKIMLPKKDSKLTLSNATATQDYKKPASHYDECSFLGKLKNLGIGRPSTIKSIIDKIQTVNYVKVADIDGVEKQSLILKLESDGKIKEERKKVLLGKGSKKFVPTDLGITITKFLIANFPQIMDYKFTSGMEEKLDGIEEGKIKMLDVLNQFYDTFKPLLEKLNQNISVDKFSLKQMKEIGIHPETKYKIYASLGKFGPMIQMLNGDNKIINTAPLREPFTMDTITIGGAVELLRYPIDLGKYNKKNVYLCRGQYGYYIEHDKNKISLGTEIDVDKFTLENAITKIEEKKSKTLWQYTDKTNNYIALTGPYGNFVNVQPVKTKTKGKNYSLGDADVKTLTIEQVQEIIKNSYNRKKYTTKPNTQVKPQATEPPMQTEKKPRGKKPKE